MKADVLLHAVGAIAEAREGASGKLEPSQAEDGGVRPAAKAPPGPRVKRERKQSATQYRDGDSEQDPGHATPPDLFNLSVRRHPAQHRSHQSEGHAGRNSDSPREQNHDQSRHHDQDISEFPLAMKTDHVR